MKNPLSELLFIVCSTLTQEANYVVSYRSLRRAFPTAAALGAATPDDLARSIARAGLSRRKAKGMRGILDALIDAFGHPTLAPLRRLEDLDCERFLTGLPLVGLKTARCVMLFSLDRAVFPVDTHCWRIAQRLGWASATRQDGSCSSSSVSSVPVRGVRAG